MRKMPVLETERLLIRPFVDADLDVIHELLSLAFTGQFDAADTPAFAERKRWLDWSVLNHEVLAELGQPPYGDRAVVLKESGQLIGSVGFVPCLDFFGQLPTLHAELGSGVMSTEFGMFWACHPQHQRRGYTIEAAQAMVDYAFTAQKLRRVVATTEYDNEASIGVMRKLGMRIERNMQAEPGRSGSDLTQSLPDRHWLQVVGILDNPHR
ncbi:MAG: GNAT family N-acetyltransferase [Anaerolineales bacterium]